MEPRDRRRGLEAGTLGLCGWTQWARGRVAGEAGLLHNGLETIEGVIWSDLFFPITLVAAEDGRSWTLLRGSAVLEEGGWMSPAESACVLEVELTGLAEDWVWG